MSSTLHTPGFAHYSVAWSPFHNDRLAVASAANFGLVGNGRVQLLSLGTPVPGPPSPISAQPAPSVNLEKFFATQDGIFDVAWSEVHENQLVSASGDGSLRLWDVTLNDLPIRLWQEHTREVFSVDWSNVKKDTFLSSSWDGTVKLWIPERPHSVMTLHAHQGCVYQALFNPHHSEILASCASDGTIRIFDLRSPSLLTAPTSLTQPTSAPALLIPPTGAEILSLDWNKYRPFLIASGGTDKKVRIWDCRMLKTGPQALAESGPQVGGLCETELLGHEYAIRKVQWSPHKPDVIASASYDMTCRVWTTSPPPGRPQLMHIQDTHTEFVVGCGWALYEEGLLASCGWDCRVNLFRTW